MVIKIVDGRSRREESIKRMYKFLDQLYEDIFRSTYES